MKVYTEIKRSDLMRFNIAILPRMKSTYITIAFIAVVVFIILVIEKGFPVTVNDWLAIIAGSIGGGIGGMLGGIIFSFIFILFSSTKSNGTLGCHEYEIDEHGLHEKTQANEGLNKWEGIHNIKIAGPYLLFSISGFLYHIIPKRSFPSEIEFNNFVTKAQGAWNNAHNK